MTPEKSKANTINERFLDKLFDKKLLLHQNLFSYNLGLYNYKKKNYGMALYHFEKSYALSLYDKKTRGLSDSGLKAVRENLQRDKVIKVGPFTEKYFSSSFYPFEVGFIILALTLTLYLFKNRIGKRIFFLLTSFFIILGIFWSFTISYYRWGVVIEPVALRIGPSKVYRVKNNLEIGQKILVNRRHFGGQYRIVYPSSLNGWVEASKIGLY